MRNKVVVLSSLLMAVALLMTAAGPSAAQTPGASPSPDATPSSSPAASPTANPTGSPNASPTANPTGSPNDNPNASPTASPVPTPVEVPAPSAGDRYYSETGYTVPEVFVKYWDGHGGLSIFGFPISEARVEKSRTDGNQYVVQYFERNRFEWHPEFAGTHNEVLLGLLGVELTRQHTFPDIQPFSDSPGRVYLDATRHSLGEPFLSYWRNNGGLAIFGYPISEPFDERNPENGITYLVQYFQRNRFEFHPENQPPYDVLLGLLGRDLKELQESINPWGPPIPGGLTPVDPIWPPAKPAAGGKFLRGSFVGDGMIVQAYWQDQHRILNMINDLGFTWIKQQVLWKDTETSKGTFAWGELDNIVNNSQAHNVRVLLSVVKAPTWATGGANGFPRDPQDLADFMSAIAAHFKGRVGAYEIWNEQNLAGESGDVNPARYVELLRAAYVAVKSVDPDAVIVSGAMAPTGINDPQGKRQPGAEAALSDTRYIEQMYQWHDGEVRRYFDALGTHPYGFNNPPDTNWPDNPSRSPAGYTTHNSFYFRRIEDQRAIMEKYGDGQKQVWVTEYGWCSDYRPDGYAECKDVTPEQQGRYIVGAMQRSKTYYPWMGPMFLWNFNFSTFQEWFTGPSHFSIINGDWTPRPAYFIIRSRPR